MATGSFRSVTRKNRAVGAVVAIIVAAAVIIAMGLATAWFVYCRYHGAWLAFDMPAINQGGTWKLYCRP